MDDVVDNVWTGGEFDDPDGDAGWFHGMQKQAEPIRSARKRAPERVGRVAGIPAVLPGDDEGRYATRPAATAPGKGSSTSLRSLLGGGDWGMFVDEQKLDHAPTANESFSDEDESASDGSQSDQRGDGDSASVSSSSAASSSQSPSVPGPGAEKLMNGGLASSKSSDHHALPLGRSSNYTRGGTIVADHVRSAADDLEHQLFVAEPRTVAHPLLTERSADQEFARARTTQRQRALCDFSMEMRILLQPLMGHCARLPSPPDVFRQFVEDAGTAEGAVGDELEHDSEDPETSHWRKRRRSQCPKLADAQQAAVRALDAVVCDFLALRGALLPADADRPADSEQHTQTGRGSSLLHSDGPTDGHGTSTRQLDQLWKRVLDTHDSLEPWLCGQLDSLSARALGLSSATAAAGSRRQGRRRRPQAAAGGLRSVRPLSVRETLDRLLTTDSERLRKRARTIRRPVARVGLKLLSPSVSAATDGGSEQPAARTEVPAGTVDEEIYDDTDFYQQLLKQIIQQTSEGTAQQQATAVALRQQQRALKTHSRVVDRKASKGRKLRFNVHDKLVNFMAPRPISSSQYNDITGSDYVNQLFSSLFQG